MSRIIEELKALAQLPDNEPGTWLAGAEEGVEFLKTFMHADTTVLYASLNAVMIHAVLVPLKHLDTLDHKVRSNFPFPDDSWIIEHASGGGQDDRVYLAPPLRRLGKGLDEGEKLVFKRSFSGRQGDTPVELNQKLVHALDLHFIEERDAWCRLDEDGDLVDVIKITRENIEDWTRNVTIVTIHTREFVEYLQLAGLGMLVFFDFTRTRPESFSGWNGVTPIEYDAPDLWYGGGVMGHEGSYVNGRIIARPNITYAEIVKSRKAQRDPATRQYAVFKAIDLKTKNRIEVSADPSGLSNYFQPESTLPLEMSPAFFKADVLHRYKADPSKYDLQDRCISCRGAWELRTYDMNREGQVHTYLRYLAELPYKEQLYWQSFNEWPKGGLSERAITTDFKGEVYLGTDPLTSLKQLVIGLDDAAPAWWQPRGEAARKAVRYPVTSSASEWGDEILALDQFVNEGFMLKGLKQLAKEYGLTPQPDWRAFKFIEECLAFTYGDRVEAKGVADQFRRLRELRNHLKGHASGKKRELEKQAITGFGSFRAHFEDMANDIHKSLRAVVDGFGPMSEVDE